jgi:UDP-galactose transporter B1
MSGEVSTPISTNRKEEHGNNSTLALVICSLGIFFFYFRFSLAQHDIYAEQKDGTKFTHTSLQLFFMILVNCIGAYFANLILSPLMGTSKSLSHSKPVFSFSELTNPYSWLSIGLCFYGAMDASNRSLSSLSYPVMVLGKSCKMVPVMFAGVLINGKKYPWTKYLSVFVVTCGIVIVNFYGGKNKSKGNKKDESQDLFALCLLLLSLVLDAVVGPRQEHHRNQCKKKGTPLSPWETMLKTNLAGLIWAGIACYLTGGFGEGIDYLKSHSAIWEPFALFALCSVVGQTFIFYTIIKFGALSCTTICTTRKFFTIVYTATVKGNPLSQEQWVGAVLVMGGLLLDMITKNKNKKKTR